MNNKKYHRHFLSLKIDIAILSNKKAQLAKLPALFSSVGLAAILVMLFLIFADVFDASQVNIIKSTNDYVAKADDIIIFLKMPVGDKTVADLIAEKDFDSFRIYLKKYLNTDKCFLKINNKIENTGCAVVKKPIAKLDEQLPLYNNSVINVYLELEW